MDTYINLMAFSGLMMCDVYAFSNLIKTVHRPALAMLYPEEGVIAPLNQSPSLTVEFHKWYSGEMHMSNLLSLSYTYCEGNT